MLETSDELTRLQTLLDASMAAPGPHLRSIIADDRRLSAPELTARLPGLCLLVLATVTADGRPLAGPVDGYFLHGTFWFSSGTESVRAELRTRSKSAVAAAENGDDDAAELLRMAVKRIDKAASQGVIHKNTAANHKSRLVRRVSAIEAAAE